MDIRKDHACPHCRAAFSLIDPEAVKSAGRLPGGGGARCRTFCPDLADALVMLERDRAARSANKRKRFSGEAEDSITGDLFAAGVAVVVGMLMGKVTAPVFDGFSGLGGLAAALLAFARAAFLPRRCSPSSPAPRGGRQHRIRHADGGR